MVPKSKSSYTMPVHLCFSAIILCFTNGFHHEPRAGEEMQLPFQEHMTQKLQGNENTRAISKKANAMAFVKPVSLMQ
ncbi:hypothetical protein A4A49_00910 [Nicotiana attenuata]|uniref:Uncharacterized protein n=1 Tax=Nicotiana attenuata TaxID=49451 RepID=A0A1J6IXD8_NICAT|nr:hypothetical protein A4A49_00910 [Nicotiana attenuata]